MCSRPRYQKMTQSWTETPDLMTVQKDPSQLEHYLWLEHEQVHLYLQIEALKCKFIIMLPLRHCGLQVVPVAILLLKKDHTLFLHN